MLWILIAVGIVVLFLVLGFALKKVKEVLDVLVILLIVGSILILAFGILVIMDARDFQSKINELPKRYILVEDQRILTGIQMNGVEEQTYFTLEEINVTQGLWDQQNLEQIRGNDYKIFIFDILSFDDILTSDLLLPGLNVSLSREEIIAVLTEKNGRAVVVRKIYDHLDPQLKESISLVEFETNMLDRLGDEESFKGKTLSLLLDKAISTDYLEFLKGGIRKDHIRVYPQTIMFTMIKYAPEQLMRTIVG